MMRQTSLEAYWSLSNHQLNRNQKIIFEALQEIEPASNKEIAQYIHWPINSVTPRVLVTQSYVAKDRSGRRVIFWETKGES